MDKRRKKGISDIISLVFSPEQVWHFLHQRTRSLHSKSCRVLRAEQVFAAMGAHLPSGAALWAGQGWDVVQRGHLGSWSGRGAGLPTVCQLPTQTPSSSIAISAEAADI